MDREDQVTLNDKQLRTRLRARRCMTAGYVEDELLPRAVTR